MQVSSGRILAIVVAVVFSGLVLVDRWQEASQQQRLLRLRLSGEGNSELRISAGLPTEGVSELGVAMQRILLLSGAKQASAVQAALVANLDSAGRAAVTSPRSTGQERSPSSVIELRDPEANWQNLLDELDRIPPTDLMARSQLYWRVTDLKKVDRERIYAAALRELQTTVVTDLRTSPLYYNLTLVALRVAVLQSGSDGDAIRAFQLAIDRAPDPAQHARLLADFAQFSRQSGAVPLAKQIVERMTR